MNGWIKIHRKLLDNWLWIEKPFSRGQAWVDLLLTVNHKQRDVPFDGNVVCVGKGEIITSLRKLSERWGWSVGKVSRFLEVLEKMQMIEQKRDTKKTHISVIKYSEYQNMRTQNKTEAKQRQNTNVTQTETNKKDKKNILSLQDNILSTKTSKRFSKPSPQDIKAYCVQRANNVCAERFFDYYEANGWCQGKGRPIKDWRAAVRTWEQNDFSYKTKKSKHDLDNRHEYSKAQLEKWLDQNLG